MFFAIGSPGLSRLAIKETIVETMTLPRLSGFAPVPNETLARNLVPALGLSRGRSLFAAPARLPTGPVPAEVIIEDQRRRNERENEKGIQIPLYMPPPPPPRPRDIDGNERATGDEAEGDKRGIIDVTDVGNIDFTI